MIKILNLEDFSFAMSILYATIGLIYIVFGYTHIAKAFIICALILTVISIVCRIVKKIRKS